MIKESVILANGSSIVGATNLDFRPWGGGAQAMLIFEATTIAPAINECQLVLKSPNGTDINVSSSKVLTSACAIGPLYLPAGSYAIKNIASSAITVYASIHPTP